ncbi:TetR/AcrR family transcriptional regulator [Novosphingobium sp. PS1R-30]|uniref:TetR/AcrR family transcriptional regulator n=1 Tax=Novosphingobium anseongense TaxID=3133436 RepID=A0ABU8S0S2_9SPHN
MAIAVNRPVLHARGEQVETEEAGLDTVKKKRIRRDPDTARKLILDAAEKVMLEEGYAAVSSRRVAQDIGVNGATVHYYYPTTDDLFIALHARMTDQQLIELGAVLAQPDPLQALWDFQSNWGQSALGVEFIALSNHRKALQSKFAIATDQAREQQADALQRAVAGAGVDTSVVSPLALTTILVAIARTLANEERVGITRGHDEVRAVVSRALSGLVKQPAQD